MKYLAIFLGVILIIPYGCKKETTIIGHVLYIDSQYNSFKFKKYSYWVYKNATTNQTDSIGLFSVDSGFYWNPPPVHNTVGTKREFYAMWMHSKNDYAYLDLIDSYGIRRNPTTDWYICGRIIYSIKSQSNFEQIDSLSINGRVFHNVTKCKILANDYPEGCSNSGFTFDTDLYIVADYGVIRKVIYEYPFGATWDLIRWNIIK